MVFYKDLDKVARGILSDDYSLKRTLKVKHTTPSKLTVTTKNEHQKGVAGAIEAKFYHPSSEISIDKISLNPDGSCGAEVSRRVSKEVVLRAKLDDTLKGEITAEHVHTSVASKVTVDTEGTYAKTSTCVAMGPMLVGGEVNTDLSVAKTSSAVKSYSVGASTGGSTWGASLICTNKLQTYNAAGYYVFNPQVTGSVMATATPEKNENTFTAGVKYAYNPKTTLRAKVTSTGVLSGCATQSVMEKVNVTVTSQVTRSDTTPKVGLMCQLG